MDFTGLPQVYWKCPHKGVLKINVDESYNPVTNIMCTGGLIRDAKGDWKSGFSSVEGPGYPLLAELIAVKNGLKHTWQEGHRNVQCETDSLEVVSLLTDAVQLSFHAHGFVINEILSLVRRDVWTVDFSHALREANMPSDFLAKDDVNFLLDGLERPTTPVGVFADQGQPRP